MAVALQLLPAQKLVLDGMLLNSVAAPDFEAQTRLRHADDGAVPKQNPSLGLVDGVPGAGRDRQSGQRCSSPKRRNVLHRHGHTSLVFIISARICAASEGS